VAASLENGPSLLRTAEQLGISARSLQRYLADTGSRFSDIVADVRLATACRLLAETDDEMARISSQLGYSRPSGFSRSFMRLMKIPPAAYRRTCRPPRAGK